MSRASVQTFLLCPKKVRWILRAAILRNVGDTNLELRDDVDLDYLGANDVEVRITHTGICHSDVSVMNGTIPQETPLVPGHEGAGIVTAVGDAVDRVSEGDHIIVAWSPPCGGCIYCVKFKRPNLCSVLQFGKMTRKKFRQDGELLGAMVGAGTFAERTLLPEEAVVKIDEDIPLEVASLVSCGVMTGVGAAIHTAKVAPGSSVIVFGVGGVGVSAIQGALIAGAAEVVAVDKNPAKLEVAKRFGATEAVPPEEVRDLRAHFNSGEGFDYALECIGNPKTMRAAFSSVCRGGTCCIVGVGSLDEKVDFNAFEFFWMEKTLIGSYFGSCDVRTDFHKVLSLWKAGRLDLEGMIDRRLDLGEVNEGLEAVRAGEVVRQVLEM